MKHRIALFATALLTPLTITGLAQAEDFWLKADETGCELWSDEAAQPEDQIIWTGDCDKNNKASGRGLAVWLRNDEIYSRYSGTMRAGRLHDKDGLLLLKSKEDDGFEVVHGHFKGGIMNGQMVILDSDGTLFHGNYVDNMRQGRGMFVDTKGNSFQGLFNKGVANSIGQSFSAEGEAYFGTFKNNERNGLGVLYEEDGGVYVGEFKDDAASGVGSLEGPTGYFQGNFVDGVPDGPGVLVADDGTTRQGRFVKGEPEGLILVTNPDGSQETETWKDGEKVQ
ncbi:MAG: hypothetical protein ACR2O0_09130 [Rhizobiaceae bacterium]